MTTKRIRQEIAAAGRPQHFLATVVATDTAAGTITLQEGTDPEFTVPSVFDQYPGIGARVFIFMNGDDPVVLGQVRGTEAGGVGLWTGSGGDLEPIVNPRDFIVNPTRDHDELVGNDFNLTADRDINLEAANGGAGNVNVAADRMRLNAGTTLVMEGGSITTDNSSLDISTVNGALTITIDNGALVITLDPGNNVVITDLPITDPGISGALWNDDGTVKVST